MTDKITVTTISNPVEHSSASLSGSDDSTLESVNTTGSLPFNACDGPINRMCDVFGRFSSVFAITDTTDTRGDFSVSRMPKCDYMRSNDNSLFDLNDNNDNDSLGYSSDEDSLLSILTRSV